MSGSSNSAVSQDWEKPETIPDPDAKKPDDWDVDMDGEWEPAMISNPEYKVRNIQTKRFVQHCKSYLCREKSKGSVRGNIYLILSLQGEWKPKQIENPDNKGAWVHPEIDNPEYTADANMYKFEKIAVLGLDLWQVMTVAPSERVVTINYQA